MTVKPGTRIKLKASVGSYASHGRVTEVWGEGKTAEYTVVTVDQTGYRKTEYLRRDQFTIAKD